MLTAHLLTAAPASLTALACLPLLTLFLLPSHLLPISLSSLPLFLLLLPWVRSWFGCITFLWRLIKRGGVPGQEVPH